MLRVARLLSCQLSTRIGRNKDVKSACRKWLTSTNSPILTSSKKMPLQNMPLTVGLSKTTERATCTRLEASIPSLSRTRDWAHTQMQTSTSCPISAHTMCDSELTPLRCHTSSQVYQVRATKKFMAHRTITLPRAPEQLNFKVCLLIMERNEKETTISQIEALSPNRTKSCPNRSIKASVNRRVPFSGGDRQA